MRQRELKKLKAMLEKLTFGQRQELLEKLTAENGAMVSVGIINTTFPTQTPPRRVATCPTSTAGTVPLPGSA